MLVSSKSHPNHNMDPQKDTCPPSQIQYYGLVTQRTRYNNKYQIKTIIIKLAELLTYETKEDAFVDLKYFIWGGKI